MNGNGGNWESDLKYVRNIQRKNNLIFSNIPIVKPETQVSLKQQVFKVAHTLRVNLQPGDIAVVIRLNGKPNQTSSAILVKFSDEIMKHDVFDAYIKRVVNKSPIGMASSQRIFVNHWFLKMMFHHSSLLRPKVPKISLKKSLKII